EGATVSADTGDLGAMALLGARTTLVWIKNRRNLYTVGLDDAEIADARLVLEGLADGDYDATWIDPYGGEPPPPEEIAVEDGAVEIVVPPFRRDVALRLIRR